ncbi:hypothetical protein ACFV2H_03615 [Streptomyces sp. NPDC059629]|uniref:hypothetical protein n=1 Tax=Streptomyces sp. NPDC059629 TaxID=3346889 RepID=UPI0036AECE2B
MSRDSQAQAAISTRLRAPSLGSTPRSGCGSAACSRRRPTTAPYCCPPTSSTTSCGNVTPAAGGITYRVISVAAPSYPAQRVEATVEDGYIALAHAIDPADAGERQSNVTTL